MAIEHQHLLGRPFKHGTDDCYGLARHFYRDNFGLQLRNYARPNEWWRTGNLYMENFVREGFSVLRPDQDHPSQWQPADMILMAVQAQVANHCAMILPNGQILHHMVGQLSTAEPYRPAYRNWTVAVLRHKDIVIPIERSTTDLMEILPHGIRSKIAAVLPEGLTLGARGPDPA